MTDHVHLLPTPEQAERVPQVPFSVGGHLGAGRQPRLWAFSPLWDGLSRDLIELL
jgi:hypothetical protein